MKAEHFLLRRSSGFARADMVLLVFLAIVACGLRFAQRGDRVRRRLDRLAVGRTFIWIFIWSRLDEDI